MRQAARLGPAVLRPASERALHDGGPVWHEGRHELSEGGALMCLKASELQALRPRQTLSHFGYDSRVSRRNPPEMLQLKSTSKMAAEGAQLVV